MESTNLVALTGEDGVLVLRSDERRAAEVHRRLLDIEVSIRSAQFDVAELLWEIHRYHLYRKIAGGYPTFHEYVEDQFGMGERRAQYLVELWEYFGVRWRECPDMLAEARRVGWAAAKELVGIVTPQNFRDWFRIAEEGGVRNLKAAKRAALDDLAAKNRKQLPEKIPDRDTNPPESADPKKSSMSKHAVQELLTSAPLAVPDEEMMKKVLEKNDEWVTRVYRFHRDMLESVDAAVEVCRRQSEGRAKDASFCLDMICVSFLASAASAYVCLQRDELLRGVERITGLTLVAVDEKTKEIVYGQDAAERMSSGN